MYEIKLLLREMLKVNLIYNFVTPKISFGKILSVFSMFLFNLSLANKVITHRHLRKNRIIKNTS